MAGSSLTSALVAGALTDIFSNKIRRILVNILIEIKTFLHKAYDIHNPV